MSIVIPAMRGMLGRTLSVGFDPHTHANLVDAYNAWDTSRHTYVAAKSITQIVCSTATNDAIISCSGHAKLAGDLVVLDGITGAFASLNGEHEVVSVPGSGTFRIVQGSLDGTEEYEAPLPTCDWKYRKVSAVLGAKGLYSFTQGTVSLMPQWDHDNQQMLFIGARNYYFNIDSNIRDALLGDYDHGIVACFKAYDIPANGDFQAILGSSSSTVHFPCIYRQYTQTWFMIDGIAGGSFVYNTAAINDTDVWRVFVTLGGTGKRRWFADDMTTPTVNTTADSRATATTSSNTWRIGRFTTKPGYNAPIMWIGFYNSADIDSGTYLSDTKLWFEGKGITIG